MANGTPTNPPNQPPLKRLSFAFPMRRKSPTGSSSEEMTDERDLYRLLAEHEPGGAYLVGNKGMWHGGIHITEAGAGQNFDLNSGIRCIADGHVIAYRLDSAYPVSEVPSQDEQPAISAPYSTGFALVRHSMEFPRGTRLTLYSLYMHLQAFSEYSDAAADWPAWWPTCFEVTTYAVDQPTPGAAGQTAPSNQKGLRVRATAQGSSPVRAILPQGACVHIGDRKGARGQIIATEGVVPYPATSGGWVEPDSIIGGWIYLGKNNAGQLEARKTLPEAALDQVVVLPQPHPVKAGDLIGHFGRYDSLNRQASDRMVHLEVFCGEEIKTFLEQGRAWIRDHSFHPDDWNQLGLPSEPTILRVLKGTKLYGAPLHEGQEAPRTEVTFVEAFSELAKHPENRHAETTAGSDNLKLHWWKVDGADVLRNAITGWVREQNFAGGRVTREFAQSWIDFETIEDQHDPTHTLFASAEAYIDYATEADVPDRASLSKLSPLMAKIYRAVFTTGDGEYAADQLCFGGRSMPGQYPWDMQRMSRLLVKHESEWANPDKWKQLIQEIEKATGPKALHEAEQQRIETLVWWGEVKAKVPDFPEPAVFHIHPGALVGNFLSGKDECECGTEVTKEKLRQMAPQSPINVVDSYVEALNRAFVDFNIRECSQRVHFLAQVMHESGGFQFTRELDPHVLSYDPWRGRGLIQITTQANYKAYEDYSGVDFTSGSVAREKLERPPYALLSAAWFFSVQSKLLDAARRDDFIWITRIINGGFNHYDDRLRRTNLVSDVLGVRPCLKLNRSGVYKFRESRAFNERKASFAWGMWSDPGLSKLGKTKSRADAIEGYRRYLELNDMELGGQLIDKKWYGIGNNVFVKNYALSRLQQLND